jgi:hypothetical protein
VRHFHGARRGEQFTKRRERFDLRAIAVAAAAAVPEAIEINDVRRAVGRGELYEPHATAVRIERGGFRVEADDRVLRKFGDRCLEFGWRSDQTIV